METVLAVVAVSVFFLVAKIWKESRPRNPAILSALRKGNLVQTPLSTKGNGILADGWDRHVALANQEVEVAYGCRPGTTENNLTEALRIKLHKRPGETLVRFVDGILIFISVNENLLPIESHEKEMHEILKLVVQTIQ